MKILRHSLRRSTALQGALAAAMLLQAGGAIAADATGLEEITITGTNIRRSDVSPVVNVQLVDRERIEASGGGQMVDMIKEIPSNTGTNQYNENSILSGTAQFSLRGLGYSSTLVLVNGRRTGVAPLSDKSSSDFVDVNQFPLAMVSRLEVLKDGSSAIYGSEAVAGVVNIITRKGFEGIEVSANYASSSNEAASLNLAAGHTFDRGSVNLYATYYHQTGNQRTDFDWLVQRVGGNGVPGESQLINSNGFPSTYQLATTNAAGRPTAAAGAVFVPDPNCVQAGGIFRINNGVTDRTTCQFDFADQVGVVPLENRGQVFVEGEFAVNDDIKYFNESSFSRNLSKTSQYAGGFSNGAAVGGFMYVAPDHPFNFFVRDPNNANNIIAIDPAQWNPAIHQAVGVVANFRVQGKYFSGAKRQYNTNIRTVNGLDITLSDNWFAEVSHMYAVATYEEFNPIAVNATNFNTLVASGRYNPFATSIVSPNLVSPKDGRSVAANSQTIIDQLFYTSSANRRTEQNVVDASVSGTAFELPTGPVSVAIGGQFRGQSLRYVPDGLLAAGLGTSSTPEIPFSGKMHVWSGYVEGVVPYHDVAELQVAVRHEDFGSVSTTDPKITARVNVLQDTLAVRASWGTSFQAPTLAQGATTQLLTILNDNVVLGPTGLMCRTITQGNGASVINTGGGLSPQNSKNINAGIDVTPTSGLKVSADYWRYDYSNLISAGQPAQSIVSGECVNGQYVADPRVKRGVSGLVDTVNTTFINVGKVLTDGFDIAAMYATPVGEYGDLSLNLDATYTNKFDIYNANGSITKGAGSRNFNTNFAPMPKWRGNIRASWAFDIHSLTLGFNYLDGYTNDQSFNAPVGSHYTVDMQYGIGLDEFMGVGKETALTVGVNNVFDRDPPSLNRYTAAGVPVTGPLAVDRPGYDALGGANVQGRTIYARIKQTF